MAKQATDTKIMIVDDEPNIVVAVQFLLDEKAIKQKRLTTVVKPLNCAPNSNPI